MRLFGFDTETGNDFDKSLEESILSEVGGVMWDTHFDQPVELMSTIVYDSDRLDNGEEISEEVAEYNGIPQEMVDKYGRAPEDVIKRFVGLVIKSDRIVAQNGEGFDKPVMESFLSRNGFDRFSQKYKTKFYEVWNRPWIDTTMHIDYPKSCRHTNLVYLAGYHKMVNFFSHRAVTDALMMMQILRQYDLETVVKNADMPVYKVYGNFPYKMRDQVKNAGLRYFDWENKVSFVNLREDKVEQFIEGLPENIRRMTKTQKLEE